MRNLQCNEAILGCSWQLLAVPVRGLLSIRGQRSKDRWGPRTSLGDSTRDCWGPRTGGPTRECTNEWDGFPQDVKDIYAPMDGRGDKPTPKKTFHG